MVAVTAWFHSFLDFYSRDIFLFSFPYFIPIKNFSCLSHKAAAPASERGGGGVSASPKIMFLRRRSSFV